MRFDGDDVELRTDESGLLLEGTCQRHDEDARSHFAVLR
jgi:hypothetical protein